MLCSVLWVWSLDNFSISQGSRPQGHPGWLWLWLRVKAATAAEFAFATSFRICPQHLPRLQLTCCSCSSVCSALKAAARPRMCYCVCVCVSRDSGCRLNCRLPLFKSSTSAFASVAVQPWGLKIYAQAEAYQKAKMLSIFNASAVSAKHKRSDHIKWTFILHT